jgi:hypothetical protein
MTRQSQKESERKPLDELLLTIGLTPDEITEGEQPDFMLAVSARTIGVEVTMYQSGTTVGAGFGQRQVESEWEGLLRASRDFRSVEADISDVNVGLMFHDVAPARRDYQDFMTEIAAFIRSRVEDIGATDTAFWSPQFTSPLMKRYLRTLHLRTCAFAEWYSNITAGWVARPDATLESIVAEKAAKTYRASDELWLVIQCSHRVSETVLPLEGAADLNAISVQGGPFAKTYLLTMHGNFEWDRSSGWSNLGPTRMKRSSFDVMKSHLTNPELLTDPLGWRDREIQQVLQEIREGKIP